MGPAVQPTLLTLVRRPAGSKAHVFLRTACFPNSLPNQAVMQPWSQALCVTWDGAPDIVTVILRLKTASIRRRTKGIVQKLIQPFKPHTLEYIGKGAGEDAAVSLMS